MLHDAFWHASLILHRIRLDFIRFLGSLLQSRSVLAAENLFLRKQLALYQERQVRLRRATDATRLSMVLAARLFDWKEGLISVRPETFTGWHRQGFKMLWRWKSRPIGRPRIPKNLRQLILTMARDNPTWGQARIAAELLLKLRISPRTVQKYLLEDPKGGRRQTVPSQRWMTFVRNHAKAMLACDFFVSVTVRFRVVYVFLIMEVGTRRLIHFNITSHPTATWTLQQRLIGSLRRDCLDFLIPMSDSHFRRILKDWQIHYNQARPHSSLGPGFPRPMLGLPVPPQKDRHQVQPAVSLDSSARPVPPPCTRRTSRADSCRV
jgi:putative transposase